MQALFELLAGFIAMLVVAALGQFGVDIERPRPKQPEVHRVGDCPKQQDASILVSKSKNDC